MDPADIDHRFAFHAAATQEKRDEHAAIRQLHARLAHEVNERLPDGREKSLVITKLEESMMWANAGIARSSSSSGDEGVVADRSYGTD